MFLTTGLHNYHTSETVKELHIIYNSYLGSKRNHIVFRFLVMLAANGESKVF
jgi:hypothetical protein